MPVWDSFLTERDRAVYAMSGYGTTSKFGERPAVLIIDAIYDFVGHEPAPILESITAWRNSCGEEGWASVKAISTLLEDARKHSLPIFYSTNFDPRSDGLGRGVWRNSRFGEPSSVPGFRGTDIVKEIAPEERDIVVRKGKPSAFFGTNLLSLLLELGVDSLIICGGTTSGCVRASVIDAFNHNFKVFVVEEGTFDRGQASHAINLFDMDAKYADVVSLQATLAYLADLPDEIFVDQIAPAELPDEEPPNLR